MRPKVSVIVPCYNCAKSVEKTLDSLRLQTLDEIEVIAINDGSKDNTLEVLHAYQKKYPNFQLEVFSQENKGIAEVRNIGLSKVTGKYFGFLDSDDYTEPTMFEKLYRCCEQDHLQMAISDFYWVYDDHKKLQKDGPYEIHEDMLVKLFAVLWNKLYLTDFVRSLNIQFPTGYRYEDACFLYCLTPHLTKIGFVDEPFVSYVQHDQSITHTNNDEVKDMVVVFEKILSYYRQEGLYEQYHDALEYLHIKFFLGNSFLRSSRIEDPNDRKKTIMLGWNLLNEEFPNWKNNSYLRSLGGMKNRYFRIVNKHNLMFFAWIFRHFKKDNV